MQRITKIKPFINKYNLEGINFTSRKDNWRKCEKNNVTIVLNVLYAKKEKICSVYVSKHNVDREKQLILWGKTVLSSKWGKMVLSCSKRTFSIIKRNNLTLEIIVVIQGEYRGVGHGICNLKCSLPKKISIVFQNGSNYDYHFIIKQSVNQRT